MTLMRTIIEDQADILFAMVTDYKTIAKSEEVSVKLKVEKIQQILTLVDSDGINHYFWTQ